MILLFLSDISWYGLHQRPQHIALALARQWTILWIQPATLGSKSVFTPVSVEPNIHVVSVPAIPYNAKAGVIRAIAKMFSRVPLFRKFITLLQVRIVHKALSAVGRDKEPVGVVIHNFQLINLLDKFQPAFVLLDYLDNAFGFTSLPSHVEEYWKKAIQQSDVITVTSPTLKKQVERHRTGNIHLVGNGVEYNLFSKRPSAERPDDMPGGKPIIGYIGAVYPWLDYELIGYAADAMPGAEFVFIGPVHPDVASAIGQLRRKQNVRFLGLREYQKIPSYLHWFDIGIIPFKRNELTVAVNPVKLYEYSAAGKPTVVTGFSDDLEQFNETICIARSKEDFISCLNKALEKSKDQVFMSQLQSFARQHDWDLKTSAIIQLIQKQLASGIATTKDS
jgi:glycosyltransferase involved in cell wall biosynthesis